MVARNCSENARCVFVRWSLHLICIVVTMNNCVAVGFCSCSHSKSLQIARTRTDALALHNPVSVFRVSLASNWLYFYRWVHSKWMDAVNAQCKVHQCVIAAHAENAGKWAITNWNKLNNALNSICICVIQFSCFSRFHYFNWLASIFRNDLWWHSRSDCIRWKCKASVKRNEIVVNSLCEDKNLNIYDLGFRTHRIWRDTLVSVSISYRSIYLTRLCYPLSPHHFTNTCTNLCWMPDHYSSSMLFFPRIHLFQRHYRSDYRRLSIPSHYVWTNIFFRWENRQRRFDTASSDSCVSCTFCGLDPEWRRLLFSLFAFHVRYESIWTMDMFSFQPLRALRSKCEIIKNFTIVHLINGWMEDDELQHSYSWELAALPVHLRRETIVETEMGRAFSLALHAISLSSRSHLDFQEWKILKFQLETREMECVRSINSNLFRRMAHQLVRVHCAVKHEYGDKFLKWKFQNEWSRWRIVRVTHILVSSAVLMLAKDHKNAVSFSLIPFGSARASEWQ